jgi:GNAT superfamily N-acetyltransferase
LPEYAEPLAAMQSRVFPTLHAEELFTVSMYRAQIAAFPEGQLTALLDSPGGPIVVGATTTFRTNRDFDGEVPYYFEVIGEGMLTTHEPDGEWLYGVDVSVDPDYRRLGIGSRIYDARRELVRRLNLRGERVAGMLPGYEPYRSAMPVERYVERVAAGRLIDPTLSWQLRNGFQVQRLLHGYIHDPRSNDTATLLTRLNPDYVAEA